MLKVLKEIIQIYNNSFDEDIKTLTINLTSQNSGYTKAEVDALVEHVSSDALVAFKTKYNQREFKVISPDTS